MIGILTLHIVALISWCAALLLMLGALATSRPPEDSASRAAGPRITDMARGTDSLIRLLFTGVASPAALLTIIAGSVVFLIDQTTAPWLILKLTLVTCLVAGHGFTGMLILRLETGRPIQRLALVLAAVLSLVMLLIVWLVLAKPASAGALSLLSALGPTLELTP